MDTNILLRNAILKLKKGEIEESITIISKARREICRSISISTRYPDERDSLKKIASLLECAALYYFALSKSKQVVRDDVSKLVYLCQSLGISNVLDSVVLPLVKGQKQANDVQEFVWLSALDARIRQELGRSTASVIDHIKTRRIEKASAQINEAMKKIIDSVDLDAEITREHAIQLAHKFKAGDFKQARRIFEWVRDEISYMHDPLFLEEIQSPQTTLRRLSGDCEDQAILLNSLLSAIGFNVAFIFADADGDGIPDHVYSGVYIPTAPDYNKPFPKKELEDGKNLHDWIPLDPTSEDSDFGVIPIEDLEAMKLVPISQSREFRIKET